ncbi:conserved hypothetical protein [Corynebacterium efficiens YS-314]|uniref:TVP38/TMEM64 family membrane protein n=2 Tax=Corynebacterium efficiens TaxID=152794 RepID=Q8FTB7_COREF|nr:conserved hypothetical protein [Corynebacterium efficiens YS-314]
MSKCTFQDNPQTVHLPPLRRCLGTHRDGCKVSPMSSESRPGTTGATVSGRVNTPFSSFFHFLTSLVTDAWGDLRRWPTWKKVSVLTAFIVVVGVTVVVEIPSITTLRDWADSAGPAFVWLFVGLYVVITQFPIPRTVLTLASGVLFGPWQGTLIALGSTTVSAALSLLIVRGLLGGWMRPRLTHPAVARINARLRDRGWLAIASLRMIAAVPFSLLNYVAALTSVPLLAFTVATAVGSAPGTIATVVLGDAVVGSGSATAVVFTIALACLGVVGLILDRRLPVKSVK